jgi:hypothetical protein
LEIWKDIDGFIGIYQVSNLGRIKSLARHVYMKRNNCNKLLKEKMLKTKTNKNDYISVVLCKDGKQSSHLVHRLVAGAFIPNPEGKKVVNHKNGKKSDNNVKNLEWTSPKGNSHHAWDTGLNDSCLGINHCNGKLSNEEVRYIRRMYVPHDVEFGGIPLARKFGVHPTTINGIVNNRWRNRIVEEL